MLLEMQVPPKKLGFLLLLQEVPLPWLWWQTLWPQYCWPGSGCGARVSAYFVTQVAQASAFSGALFATAGSLDKALELQFWPWWCRVSLSPPHTHTHTHNPPKGAICCHKKPQHWWQSFCLLLLRLPVHEPGCGPWVLEKEGMQPFNQFEFDTRTSGGLIQ